MYLKGYANHRGQTILGRDVEHHNVSCTKMTNLAGLDGTFLAHQSHSDKVSFCDHILSVVCPCVRACVRKQFLKMTSPPKPLI